MDEQQLIEGLKMADNKTLEYVYKEVVPSATSYLRKDIKDINTIEDLVLSAMEVLLINARNEKIKYLKGGIGAYFMGIVKNIRLKHFEKSKKAALTLNEDTFQIKSQEKDLEYSKEMTEKENYESRITQVNDALNRLSDVTCKKIILARYQDDIDPRDIAEEYDISYDAFRKRLSRCMKGLREILRQNTN